MSEIKFQHAHSLGLDKARELAVKWIDDASRKMGLTCKHVQGATQDTVTFERSGVKGTMLVSGTSFNLDVKLGMMMAAFKPVIESEIAKNLASAIEKASGHQA